MPQNTNIKSDHDALLERIAIAIEEKTGASPDEQTDRKSASGAMLERIAEAIENGTGGGSSGGGDIFMIIRNGNTANKTYREAGEACLENKIIVIAENDHSEEDGYISTKYYFKMNTEVNANVDENGNITSVSGSDGQMGFSSQENLDDLIVFYTE